MKNISFLLFLGCVLSFAGCRKKNEQSYLRFGAQTITLAPTPGAYVDVAVESNIAWKLTTNADWLQLSKTSGSGNDTVRISASKDNAGNSARTIVIIASSPDGAAASQAHLMVTQTVYDVQLLERKILGGNNNERATGIAATADGGYIVVGSTNSNNSGHVTIGHGGYDYWVARVTSNHDTLWTRVLGGTNDDFAQAVVATPDGGFIVAGYTSSAGIGDMPAGFGGADIWVVKLTGSGNIAWTRMLGGSNNDQANSVTADADGNILVSGITLSNDIDNNLSTFKGGIDMLVIKLAVSGDVLWTRTLGGPGIEVAQGITADQDGGAVVVGSATTEEQGGTGIYRGGGGDLWAVRLNSNGNIAWTRMMGGSGYEQLYAVAAVSDGGFIAAGYTASDNSYDIGENKGTYDWVVLKLDSNGGPQWIQLAGGSDDDIAYAAAVTPDGGVIVGGSTASADGDIENNKGAVDCMVIKFSASGQKLWSSNFGGNQTEYIRGIVIKPNGNFVFAGTTETSNDGDVNSPNKGLYDWWLVNLKDH